MSEENKTAEEQPATEEAKTEEEQKQPVGHKTTSTQTFISVTVTALWTILISVLDKRFGITLPEDLNTAIYGMFSMWIAWAMRRAISKSGVQVALIIIFSAMPFLQGCPKLVYPDACKIEKNHEGRWVRACDCRPSGTVIKLKKKGQAWHMSRTCAGESMPETLIYDKCPEALKACGGAK